MKIKAGINEIEDRRTLEKINEIQNCFFQKINKTYKLLEILTKKEKEDKTYHYLEREGI